MADSEGKEWAKDALEQVEMRRQRSLTLKKMRGSAKVEEKSKDDSALEDVNAAITDFHLFQEEVITGLKSRLESVGVQINQNNPIHGALLFTPSEPTFSSTQRSAGDSAITERKPTSGGGNTRSPELENRNLSERTTSNFTELGSSDLSDSDDDSLEHDSASSLSEDETDLSNFMYFHTPLLFLNESCFIKNGNPSSMCAIAMKQRCLGIVGPGVEPAILIQELTRQGVETRELTLSEAVHEHPRVLKPEVLEGLSPALLQKQICTVIQSVRLRRKEVPPANVDRQVVIRDAVVVLKVTEEVLSEVSMPCILACIDALTTMCRARNSGLIVPFGYDVEGSPKGPGMYMRLSKDPKVAKRILKRCHNVVVFDSNATVFSAQPHQVEKYMKSVGIAPPPEGVHFVEHLIQTPGSSGKFRRSPYYRAIVIASHTFVKRIHLADAKRQAKQTGGVTPRRPQSSRGRHERTVSRSFFMMGKRREPQK